MLLYSSGRSNQNWNIETITNINIKSINTCYGGRFNRSISLFGNSSTPFEFLVSLEPLLSLPRISRLDAHPTLLWLVLFHYGVNLQWILVAMCFDSSTLVTLGRLSWIAHNFEVPYTVLMLQSTGPILKRNIWLNLAFGHRILCLRVPASQHVISKLNTSLALPRVNN